MSKRFCWLVAVMVGAVSPTVGDDAERDRAALQGTWQATEGIGNGKAVPKEELQRIKIVFSGNKMSFFPLDGDGKQSLESIFQVDAGKKPKTIDTTRLEGAGKGKIAKGIYELDGETLKLCLTIRLEKERPTEFAAPAKSGLVTLTLKRVK